MESLFTQIANSDPFTSGAWLLFWSSAVGVAVSCWILIRKLSNTVIKAILMTVVMFLCFSLAKVELASGTVLWVPAIPFFGVDFAFEGRKYFDQLMPYLMASAGISAVLCFSIGAIGKALFKNRSSGETKATEENSSENNA